MNNLLRTKLQTNGVKKLQGVYSFKDQEGFPIDMSYEYAKDKGIEIDWIEALADASRQAGKIDGLIAEMKMLIPDKANSIVTLFLEMVMSFTGKNLDEKATAMYSEMWKTEN